MITIIFEAHGTTFDNEAHLASGWHDVALSPLGEEQSKEMGERYANDYFDAIFVSDLQRAVKSAEIAFGDKFPIVKDERLRECDYGDMNQRPSEEVDAEKIKHITEPFPNGESYVQTAERMKDFLKDLLKNYGGKPFGSTQGKPFDTAQGRRVMIIGHRATQYGLERWINGVPLEKLVSTPFTWQPGWTYQLEKLE